MKKRPVTLKTIAIKAGVSVATVSRALRNHPEIPLATCERIQALAKELGYRPNATVSMLMAHLRTIHVLPSATSMAWITSFSTADGWRNFPIYPPMYEGARERAHQAGYEFKEIWAKEKGMTGRRLTQILHTRNIRGLLIAPLPHSKGHLTLDWSQFSSITIGASLVRPSISRTAPDFYQGTLLGLRQLIRLGYRRIGFVFENTGVGRSNYTQLAAFSIFQQKLNPFQPVPSLYYTYPDWRPREFAKWFSKNRPDVICAAGAGTQAALEELKKITVRVPEDVGIVNFNLQGNQKLYAGIDYHANILGANAVDLLVGQLHRNERGVPEFPKVVLTEGKWVNGPTVRKVC